MHLNGALLATRFSRMFYSFALLTIVLLATATPAAATNLELAFAFGIGGLTQDEGHGVAVDDSDNLYITGYFERVVDFDPGPGIANMMAVGPYNYMDQFVLKLDADGEFVWATSMGTVGLETGRAMVVDSDGYVYTAGSVVQKLNPNGQVLWSRSMGEEGYDIAVDASGNVYTTGSFSGTLDFDPGLGTFEMTSSGRTDIFVSKLDSNGNFVWAKAMGGTLDDAGKGIALDSSNNDTRPASFGRRSTSTQVSEPPREPVRGMKTYS